MTTKHTPGPWHVDVVKNGGNWTWDIRTVAPHNPAGGAGIHIATMNQYLRQIESNARLIAAAPDMLAALQNAVRELHWLHREYGGRRETLDTLQQCSDTLHHATGGAP